jgi:hypothetical protein
MFTTDLCVDEDDEAASRTMVRQALDELLGESLLSRTCFLEGHVAPEGSLQFLPTPKLRALLGEELTDDTTGAVFFILDSRRAMPMVGVFWAPYDEVGKVEVESIAKYVLPTLEVLHTQMVTLGEVRTIWSKWRAREATPDHDNHTRRWFYATEDIMEQIDALIQLADQADEETFFDD